MSRKLWSSVVVVVLCLAAVPFTRPLVAAGDPITEWGIAASAAAAATGMAPLRTPITLALLQVGMFDAVSAIAGQRRPGAVGTPVAGPASPYAAAVEAGYHILLAEFPSRQMQLKLTYDTLIAGEPDSPRKRAGMEIGADVARQLLASRADDGRNDIVTYVPGTGAGVWVPTPPGFLAVTTAFLGKVTPFSMDSPSQFRPSGPPRLDSKKWRADYDEVRALGAKHGSTRTAAQTATALFWEPLAGTVWVPTIRRIAREQMLGLESSARFQAAAFAAFADSLIACWDAKFVFNFWRPVTAIQNGADDGDPLTGGDPSWEPLAVTPNFPEYPSGHACASAAVAHTIEDFFHHHILIPARNVVSGEERLYRRASHIVDEVVEARMLLGLHFRSGDEDGADIGRRIARQIRREWP
jgi:hypothetical protein